MRRLHDHIRLVVLSAIALVGIGGLLWLWQTGWLAEDRITALLAPFGAWAVPLFILAFALLILLWVPLTVLVMVAVTLVPAPLALLLSLAGLALGASGSYYIARGIGRSPIQRLLATRATVATWLTGGFARRAFASVVLMRAVGVPNNIASYVCGVGDVRYRTFLFACLAGEASGMATTAFLGNSLLDVLRADSLAAIVSMNTALGLLSGAGTLALIWWAQRTVRRQSAELRAALPDAVAQGSAVPAPHPEEDVDAEIWFAEDDLPGDGYAEAHELRRKARRTGSGSHRSESRNGDAARALRGAEHSSGPWRLH